MSSPIPKCGVFTSCMLSLPFYGDGPGIFPRKSWGPLTPRVCIFQRVACCCRIAQPGRTPPQALTRSISQTSRTPPSQPPTEMRPSDHQFSASAPSQHAADPSSSVVDLADLKGRISQHAFASLGSQQQAIPALNTPARPLEVKPGRHKQAQARLRPAQRAAVIASR